MAALAFAGLGGLAASPAPATAQGTGVSLQTSTSEIFNATVNAAPSCFRWRPKGICFWLVCTLYECHVDETLRIEHFTPDITISTFHDVETHPWADYGRVLARQSAGFTGGLFSNVSLPFGLDSAGTKTDRETRNYIYRGADAIGNPVNFVTGALANNFGTSGSGPSSIPIPLPIELFKWLTDWPSQVGAQWATIGSSYSPETMALVREQIRAYTDVFGLGNGDGAVRYVMDAYNRASFANNGGTNFTNPGGSGTVGAVPPGGNNGGGNGGGQGNGGGSDYMCPPGIMPFGLAFQSDLDSFFWRGYVPLESIYPATWLPGMREVGNGLLQTWGNVWPRAGAIYQQHPVKAAAVIAQRVGDIISYSAQPHIYSKLQLDTDPNYVFLGFQGIKEHDEHQTTWQRVFPFPQSQCAAFGENDAVSMFGFGDGVNIGSRGTVWNAWRRQDCCKRATGGAVFFLFAVP